MVKPENALVRVTPAGVWHWCPGCDEPHLFPAGRGWKFNRNETQPSLSPSMKMTLGERICHYWIREGMISFCADSTHGLANQNLPLPELTPERLYWFA